MSIPKIPFFLVCVAILLSVAPAGANDTGEQAVIIPEPNPMDRNSHRKISTWHDLRWQRTIPQTLETSCSAGAIATLLHFHFDDPTGEKEVLTWIGDYRQSRFPGEEQRRGVSMAEMRVFLESRGYAATGFAVKSGAKVRSLPKISAPVILHLERWEQGHFVLLESVREGWARIADPAQGNRRVPVAELADRWSGKFLTVKRR
uniref:Peptidase C39 family protein n=1 Tax=Candidatus Kentrum sp. DK TaxID=2126562 RepID=A0A450T166_9GAMM|nr:MAG: Peptidase C39 family protein [Candidatus Kentron sp. DK]VFJ61350.1 MAG: Peptidase C39 family protein [Candidatus Kentron sp. DK]